MGVEDLYALPPSEFTRARNALAKDLARAGEGDQAKAVRALKKPSKAAWAVNQLARWRRDEIDELVGAADRLGRAHRALLAGDGDAAAVRGADRDEKAVLANLVAAAAGFLEEAGLGASAATLRAVESTLHASALGSADRRAALTSGTLTEELEVEAGFGPTDVRIPAKKRRSNGQPRSNGKIAPPRKPAKPTRAARPAKPKVDRARQARETRLRKKLDRLRDAAERAEAAAERARAKVLEAEAELRRL